MTAAIFYPLALSLGAEALVSIERVEEFLLMEEKPTIQKGLVQIDLNDETSQLVSIKGNHCYFV